MAQNPPRKLPARSLLGGIVLAVVVLAAVLAQLRDSTGPRNSHQLPTSAAGSAEDVRSNGPMAGGGPVVPEASPGEAAPSKPTAADTPLGQLRQLPGDVLESTAGLRYGPGSREGHRLKHVLLHTKDQPSRPGSHGVFFGGRDGALATIDQAYEIALKQGARVRTQVEGKRTVYTVDLGKPVGYVGGRDGNRRGRPRVSHVRLVLEGKRVITAFPVAP